MTGLLLDAAGWSGAAALLLAYGLASAGRLDARSLRFQLLNLAGAVGLLANGIWHGAWPSAALNAVWVVIGVTAMWRIRAHRGSGARSAGSGWATALRSAPSFGSDSRQRPRTDDRDRT